MNKMVVADVERHAAFVAQAERSLIFHFFPRKKKVQGESNHGGRSVVVASWEAGLGPSPGKCSMSDGAPASKYCRPPNIFYIDKHIISYGLWPISKPNYSACSTTVQ